MVLLSRSHVLERHGQDVIQVQTASWPAMRASAKAFVLSTLSLIKVVILALATAGVHEVALRGLHKFNVLRTAQKAVLRRGPWVLQRFPQPSPQQVSAAKDGVCRRGKNKSATSVMLVRHVQVTPKESETREASRARASPTSTRARCPSTSQWHLMKPECIGRKARRSARTCPASSTILSAVVARVPIFRVAAQEQLKISKRPRDGSSDRTDTSVRTLTSTRRGS